MRMAAFALVLLILGGITLFLIGLESRVDKLEARQVVVQEVLVEVTPEPTASPSATPTQAVRRVVPTATPTPSN